MTDLKIAVVLYENMTALDAVGPVEVLRFIPGARLEFVAAATGPVLTDARTPSLTATASFDDVDTPDIVVVPGGPGTEQVLDGALVKWLRRVHPTTRWTTSVSSGSLVLGAAGLLTGGKATSHFAVADLLPMFGVEPSSDRVVVDADRRVITAAGVSSGIDMALMLAEMLTDTVTAQAVQLVSSTTHGRRTRAARSTTRPRTSCARRSSSADPTGRSPSVGSRPNRPSLSS